METQNETFLVKSTFTVEGTNRTVSFLCHSREAMKARVTTIIDEGGAPEVQRIPESNNG